MTWARDENADRVGFSLKSRTANALDVHGRFVLLAGGIALLVLACFFAKATVTPRFATLGAVLLILAAFYSRIDRAHRLPKSFIHPGLVVGPAWRLRIGSTCHGCEDNHGGGGGGGPAGGLHDRDPYRRGGSRLAWGQPQPRQPCKDECTDRGKHSQSLPDATNWLAEI
jgi:hypothetical protein